MSQSDDDLDDPDVEMNEGIDDRDYTFTPEKSCSNKSMGELNEDWTPLGKDFESCDKNKTKQIVKKAMKPINTVLNSIAPGQV